MGMEAGWPMPIAAFKYSSDMTIPRWEDWSLTALRYDPARAKQLLAEAGHGSGFKLTFWNTALPGTPFMVPIGEAVAGLDRKSTRLNSSHSQISYAVFCLKKKNDIENTLDSPTSFLTYRLHY